MESVILLIHLILAVAIICLVLLQRSEGGGLGIGGGGGGMGAFASAQSTASILSRTTAVCAACFFVTSLTLGILAGGHSKGTSLADSLDEAPASIAVEETIETPIEDPEPSIPSAPVSE